MDNKKIILLFAIIILIIAAGVIIILTSVNYERIEITPNGTSMEVPGDNKTSSGGEIESAKIWKWEDGILITYNSNADTNLIKVTELGFNSLNDLIKTGEKQNIEGVTCYVISADKLLEIHLFDVVKLNYNGKLYCVSLTNETTHDNIIICCKDKDIAVHMAQSVEYKNVYPDNDNLNNALTGVENITQELKSNNITSTIEEKTGVDLNKTKSEIEEYTGKLPI